MSGFGKKFDKCQEKWDDMEPEEEMTEEEIEKEESAKLEYLINRGADREDSRMNGNNLRY